MTEEFLAGVWKDQGGAGNPMSRFPLYVNRRSRHIRPTSWSGAWRTYIMPGIAVGMPLGLSAGK